MSNLKWGRLEVWTSMTVPPGADAFEFERKLRWVAQKRGLSVQAVSLEGQPLFTCVPRRKVWPVKRLVVSGTFDYPYDKMNNALSHYKTAKNHGFEAHINKLDGRYRVTILKNAH